MKTKKLLAKKKNITIKNQKDINKVIITKQVKNNTNIGYFISKILLENGINTFFGVPSDLNMPFLDTVIPYIKFISCRNELNASYAAEGFARTKRFSLLVVGGMVGSFVAINGFANGISERNPILMITGGNNFNDDIEGKSSHHTLFKNNNDQMVTYNCFVTLCGQENAFKIENNESLNSQNMTNLFTNISNSLATFKSVFLQIPVNSQRHNTHLDDFNGIVSNKFNSEIQKYEQYTLYSIISKWLNELFQSDFDKIKSLKPVFLIGSEYKQYLKYIEIADERFYKLMEQINASIFYTIDAKGILDEDNKNVIGYYWGGVTEDDKLEYFRETKALFYIGVDLSDYTSAGYSALFKPDYTYNCKNISTKNVFNKKLENHYRLNETSRYISKIITKNITPTTDLFVETGSSWFYGSQVKLPKGARYNISIRYGSIGWCLPASMGNAFANPDRKTICLTGDGALQCVIQEISTAATHNINLTVVIINNNMYQIENVLDKEDYNELPEYDYEKLAKSICCKDVVKCNINSFEKALNHSVNKKGFSIIVLKISENDIDSLMRNWANLVSNYTTHYI
jgi:thiamine pyrophosphate-dependent acetolactate synthase large subunit-like protein